MGNGAFQPWVSTERGQLRQYALNVMNTSNLFNTQSDRFAFADWFAQNGDIGANLQNISALEASVLETIYATALLGNQDNIEGTIVEWLGQYNNVNTIHNALNPPPPFLLSEIDTNVPFPEFGEPTDDTEQENLPP
jgi:hypothetical protein